MLSNVGRAAIRRAGLGGSHSSTTARVGQWTWQLQRVCVNQTSSYRPHPNAQNGPQHLYSLNRPYATTTKAASKKPVKKAAKKVAKPKAKPKKKKLVAKKTKPVKRKVLTEQQKVKQAELKIKTQIKELKATALKEPKGLPATAWLVMAAEATKGATGSNIVGALKAVAEKYKSLSGSEREHYNHIANQNKAANEVAYKQWVESYTPDQIRAANAARAQLKRKKVVQRPKSIHDIRQPERGFSSPRAAFISQRHKSGDMTGLSFIDASKTLTQEWKAMSASEKKPFEDAWASDRSRYEQEYKTVFHRDLPAKKVSATA